MSVYFISDGRGRVKIGYAADVFSRLSALQAGSVHKLELIRVIGGAGSATVRWLHRRYARYRTASEWFTFMEDMLTIVPPDELPRPNNDCPPDVKAKVHADLRAHMPPRLHAMFDLYKDT